MLENITERFADVIRKLRGAGRLTEDNIADTLRDIRVALLEADVALAVVRDFTERVRQRAVGGEIARSLTPGQTLIKIVHRELTLMMGESDSPLNLRATPPAAILICGLQGSGKTTTLAKIAKHLRERKKKRVMLASCDIHRPAAIEQLKILADAAQIPFHQSDEFSDARIRAKDAIAAARRKLVDAILIDTAGRTILDDEMMREIADLQSLIKPAETLLTIDAMQGQDAVNTARGFSEKVRVSGIVLSKLDGDSRGGAALSARAILGKPIKFVGVGEKLDDLESFHPQRMASRILGMGDLLTLVEEAEQKTDAESARRMVKKMMQKRGTDLSDFLEQMQQAKKLGGIASIADKLPGGAAISPEAAEESQKNLARMEATILSMTPAERKRPDILKASRKRRIAKGAGVTAEAVNQLLKQFEQMQKMMKMVGKNPRGIARMFGGLMQ